VTLLVEIVAGVLGDDSFDAVDAAVDSDVVQLLDSLADAVTSAGEKEPIAKSAGEFVPGWLPAVKDPARPYGHDPYFVFRALLYCHRVAVADPLHPYLFNENLPRGAGIHGLKEALHKILIYNELESNELLFYLPPHAANRMEPPPPLELPRDVLQDYYESYMAPRGIHIPVDDWDCSTGEAFSARFAAELEIMHGIPYILDFSIWQAKYADAVDLYFSDDHYFRDVFDWVAQRSGGVISRPHGSLHDDSGKLAALLRMPTLNEPAFNSLPVRDLINLRDHRVFERWREALTNAVRSTMVLETAGGDADRARQEFASVMAAQRNRVLAELGGVTEFSRMVGKPGAFGISAMSKAATVGASTGTTAVMGGASPQVTTAVGIVSTLASLSPAALSHLRQTLKLKDLRATTNLAFELFASDG
jgi:hypothetical protein